MRDENPWAPTIDTKDGHESGLIPSELDPISILRVFVESDSGPDFFKNIKLLIGKLNILSKKSL